LRKRILIANEKYSDNIGDQAISDAMLRYFEDLEILDVFSCDFSFRPGKKTASRKKIRKPEKRIKIPKVLSKIKFFLKNLMKARSISLGNYDYAFIGGGQLILSNSSFSVSMLLFCLMLRLKGTKIFVFSVGVGDRFTFLDAILYGWALKLCDGIYVRDERSKENLANKFRLECVVIPDIAFYLAGNIRETTGRNKDLVCPVDFEVYRRYRNEVGNECISLYQYQRIWVKIIKKCLSFEGCVGVNLGATTIKDLELCESLLPLFSEEELLSIELFYHDSWQEFSKVALNCKRVYSGRMHALILAENKGCEAHPFIISNKIKSYKDECVGVCPNEFKISLIRIREKIFEDLRL